MEGETKLGVGGEPHVQAKVVESAGDGVERRLVRLRADETASSANCGAEGEELCSVLASNRGAPCQPDSLACIRRREAAKC
jgi:hypothetical protein